MKNNPYILVVDDQPQNIELLEAYLIPYGYNIVPAVNGEEALTKLYSFPIDLVLLDVIMPGMNGFEVIRHIRQNENYHQLPIILLTALRERQDRVNGIEAGCDDFISKPIDKIELIARVQSLLKVKAYNDLMNNYRKELEHEVRIRTEQLIKSERQAAYGEIIQGIVHNLRSPLTVIAGKVYLTELFGENLNSADNQNQQNREDNLLKHLDYCKKSLKDIAMATERINQMVDSLLIKSSSDKNENLEIFDLNNTIIRELDFYSADYAYKHKLTKEILLFADPLFTKAVPAVVTQIFDNIFKNAIDELYKVESPSLTVKSGR